jgi:hypothetical protein
MEVEPTSFPFSRFSLSLLCFQFCLSLYLYLCTTDNSGARVESQQGNPLTGQSGPRGQSRHGRRRHGEERNVLQGQEEEKREAGEGKEEAPRRKRQRREGGQ